MMDSRWAEVDAYLAGHFIRPEEALDEVLAASRAAGLPPIAVSAAQGKFLHLLVRLMNASRVLEIGTLGGFSTIWMARALPPGGSITTLEYNAKHAEVAQENVTRAGVADRVQIRVGSALDTLPTLQGPFDVTFIDADKSLIPDFFEWAVKLSRPGSLIIVDNVIRDGNVVDATSTDANVQGVRGFNEMVSHDSRVSGITLQTVGSKGWDGLAFLIVN